MADDLRSAPSPLEPPSHIVDLAVQVSGWSPCRSKRGVVVFGGENVISHGYNYKPRGFDCDGSVACKETCRAEAIHAEQHALVVASYHANGADLLHVKTVNGQLVASGGPSCVQCSKLVVAYGISGVWLYHAEGWRRYEAAEFHRLSLLAPSPLVSSLERLIQQWREEAGTSRLDAIRAFYKHRPRGDAWFLVEIVDDLLPALKAARDLLVGCQKQAGYIRGQGYSATLTEHEMMLAKGIQSLDAVIERAESVESPFLPAGGSRTGSDPQ